MSADLEPTYRRRIKAERAEAALLDSHERGRLYLLLSKHPDGLTIRDAMQLLRRPGEPLLYDPWRHRADRLVEDQQAHRIGEGSEAIYRLGPAPQPTDTDTDEDTDMGRKSGPTPETVEFDEQILHNLKGRRVGVALGVLADALGCSRGRLANRLVVLAEQGKAHRTGEAGSMEARWHIGPPTATIAASPPVEPPGTSPGRDQAAEASSDDDLDRTIRLRPGVAVAPSIDGARWRETAEQEARNVAFWRGLVEACVPHVGDEVFIDDTGQRHPDPLLIKVPELVAQRMAALERSAKRAHDDLADLWTALHAHNQQEALITLQHQGAKAKADALVIGDLERANAALAKELQERPKDGCPGCRGDLAGLVEVICEDCHIQTLNALMGTPVTSATQEAIERDVSLYERGLGLMVPPNLTLQERLACVFGAHCHEAIVQRARAECAEELVRSLLDRVVGPRRVAS